MKTEYIVVRSYNNTDFLIERVNELLAEGYKLQGGICVSYLPGLTEFQSDLHCYCQAMYRETNII